MLKKVTEHQPRGSAATPRRQPRAVNPLRALTRLELEARLAESEAAGAALSSALEVEKSYREAAEAEADAEASRGRGDDAVLELHVAAVAEAERLRAKLRVAKAKLKAEDESSEERDAARHVAEEQEAVRRKAEAERIRAEREAAARKVREAERGREAAERELAVERRGQAEQTHQRVTAERSRLERIHADEKRKLESALKAAQREAELAAAAVRAETAAAVDAEAAEERAARLATVERRLLSAEKRLHAERTARAAAEVRLEVSSAAQDCARADLRPLDLVIEERGRLGVRFHESTEMGLVGESVLPAGLVASCAAEAVGSYTRRTYGWVRTSLQVSDVRKPSVPGAHTAHGAQSAVH